MNRRTYLFLLTTLVSIVPWAPASAAVLAPTVLASSNLAGNPAQPSASWPYLSPGGRYVVFISPSPDLVAGDGPFDDVFIRDLQSGTTRLISGATGAGANGRSWGPTVTSDGTKVAFVSEASNLVPGDTNGVADVFVRDLVAGAMTRESVSSAGAQANGASGSGLATVTHGAISADGSTVAFLSRANNLVDGDTNRAIDVFVRSKGRTTRVSRSSSGVQGDHDSDGSPSLSSNGRYVLFTSAATNLVAADTNYDPSLQGFDVFRFDRMRSITIRASVRDDESQFGWPSSSQVGSISADGDRVLFSSYVSGTWATAVYLRSIGAQSTDAVALDAKRNNEVGLTFGISGDGRFAAFSSTASSAQGRTNVIRADLATGARTIASTTTSGDPSLDASWPSLSNDGSKVAFAGSGACFAPGMNGASQVLVHDMTAAPGMRIDYQGATSGIYRETSIMSARLTNGAGAPVANHLVRFQLVETTNGLISEVAALTDANGIATANLRNDGFPEQGNLHAAVVAGSIIECSRFTSLRRPTVVEISSPAPAPRNREFRVRARLRDRLGGAPLPGRQLRISGMDPRATVMTDSSGEAEFVLRAPATPGTATFYVLFPGENPYEWSQSVENVQVVWPYSFADDLNRGSVGLDPDARQMGVEYGPYIWDVLDVSMTFLPLDQGILVEFDDGVFAFRGLFDPTSGRFTAEFRVDTQPPAEMHHLA